MKRDFKEFLSVLLVLFICVVIFALMGAKPLMLISLSLLYLAIILYPLVWLFTFMIKQIDKIKKRDEI